jgi:hypothetical protein
MLHAVAEDTQLDNCVSQCGMLLDKIIVTGNISVNGFGSGGVIASLAIQTMLVAVGLILGSESDFLVDMTTNVMYLHSVQGIDTLEPIAVELKHLYIERGVVGESVLDFVLFDISVHGSRDIAELVQNATAASHATHIQVTLVSVIRSSEQHRVVPNLLHNKVLFHNNLGGICVINHIADIVAKRLFQTGGFCVKNHDIHFSFPFILSFIIGSCLRSPN